MPLSDTLQNHYPYYLPKSCSQSAASPPPNQPYIRPKPSLSVREPTFGSKLVSHATDTQIDCIKKPNFVFRPVQSS